MPETFLPRQRGLDRHQPLVRRAAVGSMAAKAYTEHGRREEDVRRSYGITENILPVILL
jgi:hypothetical protein